MNAAFQEAVADVPRLFGLLSKCEPFIEKGIASQRGKAGIYVFFEDGKPVHVGRTRNLQARLRGHTTTNRRAPASFAFKRTRRILKKFATYRPDGSRSALMRDPEFAAEFDRQLASVKSMHVRFVEVGDPIKQYLLELYATLEFGLPIDEFDVH